MAIIIGIHLAAASVGGNDSNLNPDDRDDRLIDLNLHVPTFVLLSV